MTKINTQRKKEKDRMGSCIEAKRKKPGGGSKTSAIESIEGAQEVGLIKMKEEWRRPWSNTEGWLRREGLPRAKPYPNPNRRWVFLKRKGGGVDPQDAVLFAKD